MKTKKNCQNDQFRTKCQVFINWIAPFNKRDSNIATQKVSDVPKGTEFDPGSHVNRKKQLERSDFTLCPESNGPMKKKFSTQHQFITSDVLSDNMMRTMQDRTIVSVFNLDETRVKLERSLRTPFSETKIEPDCDKQIAFPSTPDPVTGSCDHVGTNEPPKRNTNPNPPVKMNPKVAYNQ